MSDVYLKAWHGGLGDALQFSTLPEEFSKQQDRKTYIVADAPFRNEGIYDLVWDKNPYVPVSYTHLTLPTNREV